MANTNNSAPHFLPGPHDGAFRAPAVGYRGMVACAHPMAAAAGIRMLAAGGNAVDAMVAVSAALGVVEPYMSSPGGGGGVMLITRPNGVTEAMDYVGHAPRATDPTFFADQEAVSRSSRSPVVPGMIAGWLSAHERFGQLDRARLFEPAVELAERGAPVTRVFADLTAGAAADLARSPEASIMLPGGQPPQVGAVIRQPNFAKSLRLIGERGADVFYRGELGERFVKGLAKLGGIMTMDDLADLKVYWHEPISASYRGARLFGPRPPSTSFQTIATLKLLEGQDLGQLAAKPADYFHVLIEALKLARADRAQHAQTAGAAIDTLVSDAYIADRRRLLRADSVLTAEGDRFMANKPADMLRAGRLDGFAQNTTHLCVADGDGMVVSVTQSLGAAYGCAYVAGDTGFFANNFSYWTDIDQASPNSMKPGRRMEDPMGPIHVVRDGKLVYAIGTPGSYGIPQTIAQMLLNHLDFGYHVQAAIEAPRLRLHERPGRAVSVERRFDPAVLSELEARGHRPEVVGAWDKLVGGGQGIALDPNTGLLSGGADPRRDGVAVGI